MRKIIESREGYEGKGNFITVEMEEMTAVVFDRSFKDREYLHGFMLKEIAQWLIDEENCDTVNTVVSLEDGISFAIMEETEVKSDERLLIEKYQDIAPINFAWDGLDLNFRYRVFAGYIGADYKYDKLKFFITEETENIVNKEKFYDKIYTAGDIIPFADHIITKRLEPHRADNRIIITQLKIHYLDSIV